MDNTSYIPRWVFLEWTTEDPHEIREWSYCKTNVLKNGDYTPKEDGVECYTIKMASRMCVHWALRQQHYASQYSNAHARHVEQFCVQQKTIARKAIDCTYVSFLRDQINQQIDVYFEKEKHYERRLEKMI